MNKKNIIIITSIIVLIIGIAIIVGITTNKPNDEIPQENGKNNTINSDIKITGKLAEYMKSLSDNYYIKYLGNFKDTNSETVNTIVEYTKDGQSFGLRIDELEVQMIYDGKDLYSISNRYKIIVQMGKESFDIGEYNLVSDIGQTYINSYTEKVKNKKYDVEEYAYNGKTLKYYFIDNDIKLIKYDDRDISVIRVEGKPNSALLTKPEGYTYAIV
jgi:hypothetical protein